MSNQEIARLLALPVAPLESQIHYKFNGAVFLVKHTDFTEKWIGSGYTLDEAKLDAQKTRTRIIKYWFNENMKWYKFKGI